MARGIAPGQLLYDWEARNQFFVMLNIKSRSSERFNLHCIQSQIFAKTRRHVLAITVINFVQTEMIPFFRTLGFTQMLTNGAEGYRASGYYDPSAPTAAPFNHWINDGRKGKCYCIDAPFITSVQILFLDLIVPAGEDFVRNLEIPGIDFYTIHSVRLTQDTFAWLGNVNEFDATALISIM